MTATTWIVDPTHSSIEFAVKHMMFTTVRGRFKQAAGRLEVDEQHPDQSKVVAEVVAASIDTGVHARDEHLRSPDFLDAERHPTIRFESKRVQGAAFEEGKRFQVEGELTIRGQSMAVTLDVLFEGSGTDPWGAQRAGFAVQTEIDRRDWGLQWNQALETGGVLVANKVRIEIEVQAVKQAETGAAKERGGKDQTREDQPRA